jgi:c-di-GMP-binding flagellar brake protein YcgR
MSASAPPRTNRRRYLRVPVRVEVLEADSRNSCAYAINLSGTGVCLQSGQARSPGERLRLRFRLPPSNRQIEPEAEVVWCTRDTDLAPGMTFYEVGLRFCTLSAEQGELLQDFVDHTARYCSADDPNVDESLGWSG